MPGFLRDLFDAMIGLWLLLIISMKSKLMGQGRYLDWRWQPAFGRGVPPKIELLLAVVRYARWTARMRRLR